MPYICFAYDQPVILTIVCKGHLLDTTGKIIMCYIILVAFFFVLVVVIAVVVVVVEN